MAETVYVRYTVQPGDTLWDLWRKTQMSRSEWMKINDGRNPDATLYAGESIVIKDPIATCMTKDHYLSMQRTTQDGTGAATGLDVCADNIAYNAFKSLRQYTEKLKTAEEGPRQEDSLKDRYCTDDFCIGPALTVMQ